jgi:hypothetical protein
VAKESGGAKLASRGKAQVSRSVATCQCGGDMIWARVYNPRPRMMKVCEKCGQAVGK